MGPHQLELPEEIFKMLGRILSRVFYYLDIKYIYTLKWLLSIVSVFFTKQRE
jgi:hypothetical protein